MEGFRREGSMVRAVVSGGESIEASRFIVATGAMTPMLNDHLGFKIPIEPGKGYSITSARTDHMPVHPIIFEDSHVAVTPMSTGFRVGSTMEFVGYNTSIHPRRLGLLTAAREEVPAGLGARRGGGNVVRVAPHGLGRASDHRQGAGS